MGKYEVDRGRWYATFAAAGLAQGQADAVLAGDEAAVSNERVLALLTIDADSIQRTLLASPRPVTIFGASASLAGWDEELRRHEGLPPFASVLFAGGGSAVLVVPKAEVENLGRELERRYRQRMEAHATSAFVEVSPRELVRGPRPLKSSGALDALGIGSEGGFGGCMANLAVALRAAKTAARCHPHLDEPTTAARCAETGDRPRQSSGTLSRFAVLHREVGGEQRRELQHARTLDDVLRAAGARRLAFICIDGAKIGSLLTELETLADYVDLSRGLDEAFAGLRDETVRAELGVQPGAHQLMLAGGDDLLLVVPAEAGSDRPHALEVVKRIVRRIDGAFEGSRWSGRVGVGAGVLITNGGLPARAAFDYARALCNSAKHAIDDENRSGVDFEVVLGGAPLSKSIASLRSSRAHRAKDYPKLGATATIRDTQCPYTIGSFEALLEVAKQLHEAKVGRSTLATLTRAVGQHDLNAGLIDVYYQLARTKERTKELVLRQALEAEALNPNAPGRWVLCQSPRERDVYQTGVRDVVTVTKLMGRR